MTSFTTAKVIAMVAVAVNELSGRKVHVAVGDEEQPLEMSLKNFVLRNVAHELRENGAPDDEVADAVEQYDEVVKSSEPIVSVGHISGGRRRTRKTRRSCRRAC